MMLMLGDSADKATIYKVFKLKQECMLYYITDESQCKIPCYVETISIPPNTKQLTAQVTLSCPQGCFESLERLRANLSQIISYFTLPFTFPQESFMISEVCKKVIADIYNNSEIEVGMDIYFNASSAVTNPGIENINTHETAQLDFTLLSGDSVHISTYRGKKSITLTRNGTDTNIFDCKIDGFTFLQLSPGLNQIKYFAGSNLEALSVSIYYKELFVGVS